MTNEERTNIFVTKINDDAARLEENLSAETEEQITALFEKGKKEIDGACQQYLQTEKEKMLKETALAANYSAAQVKRNLIARRNELCNSVFSEIRHMVSEYTKTAEYTNAVKEKIGEIIKQYKKIDKILFSEKDSSFFETVADCKKETDESITLGGFKAYVESGKKVIDFTLDTRYANEKSAFFNTEELIIR